MGRLTLVGPWPPPTGGVATHVRQLFEHAQRSGFHASVLGYGSFEESQFVRRSAFQGRTRTFVATWRGCGTNGVVHGHGSLLLNDGEEMDGFRLALRARRAHWVETVHDGTLVQRIPAWTTERRARFAARLQAAEFVIAADASLAEVVAELGIPSRRMRTIGPLLPPIAGEDPLPEELAAFQVEHRPLLVCVGAMTASHDFPATIEAFAHLADAIPGIGLILAASGYAQDPETEALVRERVDQERIALAIDLTHEQTAHLMRLADVVIRGPERESYGLSRVEAAFAGTPVVATPTGEQRYTIPYSRGNVASLIESIHTALRPAARSAIADARDYYSKVAEANLQGIFDIYRHLSS